MSDEASPRPWRVVDPHYEDAGVDIFDAEGARVCGDLITADAALIVAAVNERDRLRDLVRRMADTLEHVSNEYRFDFYELVREARAAIGEEDRK